ncbi:Putative GTP-binding protein Parf [Gryllus bimaculatus]|nr:Putative GTP-binding protein Parf [Gryllus bimaculatus]
MFSALKRLAGKADGPVTGSSTGPSHHAMSHSLQRRFARGVQYNMKIIIKGDRNVGKTCLFQRLQGQKFVEEYIPTEEIQVASIQWSYKATDDVVKVEVWDVVDRGKKKKALGGLKLDNTSATATAVPEEDQPALDAEFLDVYKNTNGVIIMMDITKSWTFDYVQRELPKVPNHIPVLVLANHCDMSHHRTVTGDHVTYFIDTLNRPSGSAQVRYAEASMRNGFGLKLLHKFFNLPFLQLQKETLLRQLETNDAEIRLTNQELDLYQESDDADYNKFLEQLMNRRRQVADMSSSALTAAATASAINGTCSAPKVPSPQPPRMIRNSHSSHQLHQPSTSTQSSWQEGSSTLTRSATIIGPIGGGTPIPNFNSVIATTPQTGPSTPVATTSQSPVVSPATRASPSQEHQGDTPLSNKPSSFMSKIFGNKIRDAQEDNSERRPSILSTSASSVATPEPITSVEEFVPDGGMLDRSFLEDMNADHTSPAHQSNHDAESDSEPEGGNPLVAGFQDDLDPDDLIPVKGPVENSGSPPVENDVILPVGLSKKESLSSLNENESRSRDHHTADALDNWLGEGWGRAGGGALRRGAVRMKTTSMSTWNSQHPLLPRSGGSSPTPSTNTKEKKKKDKHKEKGEEKKKHKKKSKEKGSGDGIEEGKKNKKKSSSSGHRRSRDETSKHNELEEFLNRPSNFGDEYGGVDPATSLGLQVQGCNKWLGESSTSLRYAYLRLFLVMC